MLRRCTLSGETRPGERSRTSVRVKEESFECYRSIQMIKNGGRASALRRSTEQIECRIDNPL